MLEHPPCLFVRDSFGTLVGRITDYAIDDADFRVVALEMVNGYNMRRPKETYWIYDYTCCDPKSMELCTPACMSNE